MRWPTMLQSLSSFVYFLSTKSTLMWKAQLPNSLKAFCRLDFSCSKLCMWVVRYSTILTILRRLEKKIGCTLAQKIRFTKYILLMFSLSYLLEYLLRSASRMSASSKEGRQMNQIDSIIYSSYLVTFLSLSFLTRLFSYEGRKDYTNNYRTYFSFFTVFIQGNKLSMSILAVLVSGELLELRALMNSEDTDPGFSPLLSSYFFAQARCNSFSLLCSTRTADYFYLLTDYSIESSSESYFALLLGSYFFSGSSSELIKSASRLARLNFSMSRKSFSSGKKSALYLLLKQSLSYCSSLFVSRYRYPMLVLPWPSANQSLFSFRLYSFLRLSSIVSIYTCLSYSYYSLRCTRLQGKSARLKIPLLPILSYQHVKPGLGQASLKGAFMLICPLRTFKLFFYSRKGSSAIFWYYSYVYLKNDSSVCLSSNISLWQAISLKSSASVSNHDILLMLQLLAFRLPFLLLFVVLLVSTPMNLVLLVLISSSLSTQYCLILELAGITSITCMISSQSTSKTLQFLFLRSSIVLSMNTYRSDFISQIIEEPRFYHLIQKLFSFSIYELSCACILQIDCSNIWYMAEYWIQALLMILKDRLKKQVFLLSLELFFSRFGPTSWSVSLTLPIIRSTCYNFSQSSQTINSSRSFSSFSNLLQAIAGTLSSSPTRFLQILSMLLTALSSKAYRYD